MISLNGTMVALCTFGIYATGCFAYAEPTSLEGTSDEKESQSITSSIMSFFDFSDDKKNVGPEVILLKKPSKEKSGQYITLSEPSKSLDQSEAKKKILVSQSFDVKPSLIFNMGTSGLTSSSPTGFSGIGANTAGHHVTFSYGQEGQIRDPHALGVSFGSQFLTEPSSILSPLFDGSEFDQINNRQVYNLSADIGYAGFKLGASFSREKMLNDPGLKGFDIGLGYAGQKWGADVKFGEYKRERERLFASTEEFYNTVYALEIGAAYQLHSNIRFTGRFTYYSYGQENDLDTLRNSQVFFLGTNVNF